MAGFQRVAWKFFYFLLTYLCSLALVSPRTSPSAWCWRWGGSPCVPPPDVRAQRAGGTSGA